MKKALFYIILTSIVLFITNFVFDIDATIGISSGMVLSASFIILMEFVFHFLSIVSLDIKSYRKIRHKREHGDYSFDRHLKIGHTINLVNKEFYEIYN